MAIELKTTNLAGEPVGAVNLDEEQCGGKVKVRLLHGAAVMYHNNLRQGTASTKTRAEISGTTKKLYRQKGTGRARAGTRKSGTRRGGGVIHGPKPRNFTYHMPRKQRRAALRNSLLAKAKDGTLSVVTGLDFDAIKTKSMVALLDGHQVGSNSKGKRSALIVTDGLKRKVYLSGRNVQGVTVVPSDEVNARQVLLHNRVLIDQKAFEALTAPLEKAARVRKPKGTRKSKGEEEVQA